MKRLIRRTALTNDRLAGERGGVTLETALVMPVFLLLVFFLIFLVKTSITAMALHGAVAQTVRLTASVWYPVSLLKETEQPAQDEREPSWRDKLNGVRETVGEIGPMLPSPLRDWAEAISEGDWSPEEEAAKAAMGQLALQLADSKVLDAARFRVTSVDLPRQGDAAEAYLTMEAEYRLPFRVPFSGQPLAIRASARERVWSGGSPSRAVQLNPDGNTLDVSFVSLEPNPVRPGRKATLVLRTRPGAVLDLTVLYKSGNSQAKHLGNAVADDSGLITWTWHVSGNTTSGQWNWSVRGEGGSSFSMSFQVERRK
ncbi:hypothetical protein GE107_13500 [Cohnella sp. CFH 77786]|uniref:TadE/TadG family type IV pilus assembly protein n=1 Tax=Cohnella sp. CFH 77786 TaxID=2662265 RepID=UPI001C610333|nr:TadE/TadG family type IV pilus assembly protein [Cohnella sp. CFH 77786]MBW5447079.1 hypothetical protein [Cohnella sp. CFH 77786]